MASRLFACLALSSISLVAWGQNELKFNQVIYIQLSGGPNTANHEAVDSQTITVPAGYVWKVESVDAQRSSSAQESNDYYSQLAYLKLNGIVITPLTGTNTSANTSWITHKRTPIWLPAGTYTLTLHPIASPEYAIGFLSAIEFQLIP